MCEGRECDTVVVTFTPGIDEELTTQDFSVDAGSSSTTLTVYSDAFSRPISQQYMSFGWPKTHFTGSVDVTGSGDGKLMVTIVPSSGSIDIRPRLLHDGVRLVIDVYPA